MDSFINEEDKSGDESHGIKEVHSKIKPSTNLGMLNLCQFRHRFERQQHLYFVVLYCVILFMPYTCLT